MLKLTIEVDTTEEGVGLACIPDESFGDFSDNDECWISGWGLTGCKYLPLTYRFLDHYERSVIGLELCHLNFLCVSRQHNNFHGFIVSGLDDEVPDILQEGKVPIPTNEECEESNLAYRLILQDFHVCVGDGDPSACRVRLLPLHN